MDLADGPVGGDLVMQVSSVLKVHTWWTPATMSKRESKTAVWRAETRTQTTFKQS